MYVFIFVVNKVDHKVLAKTMGNTKHRKGAPKHRKGPQKHRKKDRKGAPKHRRTQETL